MIDPFFYILVLVMFLGLNCLQKGLRNVLGSTVHTSTFGVAFALSGRAPYFPCHVVLLLAAAAGRPSSFFLESFQKDFSDQKRKGI